MTRVLAVMLVTMTLLANQADARGTSGGAHMGLGPHPGFAHPGVLVRPGFFPHRNSVHNHIFFRYNRGFSRRFFVGPGVVLAPYSACPYPYYPYPDYPYSYYP
jgi:hypothetical protein